MWLSVIPSTVYGTELGAQEWMDYLFQSYGINPPDRLDHYGRCISVFSIFHALDCNKGGIVMSHHNEIHGGVTDLAGKTFTPKHVRDNPKINTGRAVSGGKDKSKGKG